MDLSFTMRVRRQRRRDALATSELPVLFARLAAGQAGSVTAIVQSSLARGGEPATAFAQRVAIFAGALPASARPVCASFAQPFVPAAAPTNPMNALFTLALQASFKPATVGAGASDEQSGATPPARGPND